MGSLKNVSRIVMNMGNNYMDYPRQYEVLASEDGEGWRIIKMEERATLDIDEIVRSQGNMKYEILFKKNNCRYIRIRLTGGEERYRWTINEIELYD